VEGLDLSFFSVLADIVSVAGICVILWGSGIALWRFFRVEKNMFSGKNLQMKRESLRHSFGSYLLLGLEFLIAADIINTVMKPGLHEVAILGAIVVIRTVIGYTLDHELSSEADSRHKQGE
jgi:uncharacterized membrane protein